MNNNPLRFRLDKTVPAGKYVKKAKCNIACTWCHLDYFNNEGFIAIDNDGFYNIIKKVIGLTSSKNAYVRFAGSSDPTLAGLQELEDLIRKINSIPQVSRICMTTNGVLLGGMIDKLIAAGLSDVTVSLNSMTKEGYIKYAKRDKLNTVLDSIQKVLNTPIPLKINMLLNFLNRSFSSSGCSIHQTWITFVIKNCIVHRASVIPHQNVSFLPTMTVNVFNFGSLFCKPINPICAFICGPSIKTNCIIRIYVESFSSSIRVGTNHRMAD